MKKILGAALLLLLASGCFHIHYVTGEPAAPAPVDESWHHDWVFGLVEGDTVAVPQLCPDGLAKVDSETTFVNGLVRFLTFSIYTPETVTTTCKAGSGSAPASAKRPWK